MNDQLSEGERYYNEIVLSSAAYTSSLPHSIDGVFFIDGVGPDECVDLTGRFEGARCEGFAREAHSRLLQVFASAASDIPLMRLRLNNWEEPLELVVVLQAEA